MKYYSTNKKSPLVDFKEATIRGQAPDKGLYFPELIPRLKKEIIENISSWPDEQIAFEIIKSFTGKTIGENELMNIVKETVSFPIPLVPVTDHIYSLELFHGPTLAFKDVGARFMSRCLAYFIKEGFEDAGRTGKITVLVATSGDTGGAVAGGFLNVEGIEVVILYPSGKVSPVQEKQLTALGNNIYALEIDGSFDDCQAMVKQAFMDRDINNKLFLTSANSINVARWLPQQFYYFFAWKQWPDKKNPPVISVPSGNFGNICAGLLAAESGLPVKHFIAACNVNDVVTRYLANEKFEPRQAEATLSNAMDVGDPSNFIRILEIFQHEFPVLKTKLSSSSVTDEETLETIQQVYSNTNYILDPHGAVGYLALDRYLAGTVNKGIFLETAHPVKFPAAVEKATSHEVNVPPELNELMKKRKSSILMDADFNSLKEFLLTH